MIGRLNKHRRPQVLLNYLLRSEAEPQILANSTGSDTAEGIADEILACTSRSKRTEHPLKHLIVAFSPNDGSVPARLQRRVALDTIRGLGYSGNQFVAIAHNRDTTPGDSRGQRGHDHLHAAIATVGTDGRWQRDGWERHRLQKLLREIEMKYELTETPHGLFVPAEHLPDEPPVTWREDTRRERATIYRELGKHLPSPSLPSPDSRASGRILTPLTREQQDAFVRNAREIADIVAPSPERIATVDRDGYRIEQTPNYLRVSERGRGELALVARGDRNVIRATHEDLEAMVRIRNLLARPSQITSSYCPSESLRKQQELEM